jgi:hypothetical protein
MKISDFAYCFSGIILQGICLLDSDFFLVPNLRENSKEAHLLDLRNLQLKETLAKLLLYTPIAFLLLLGCCLLILPSISTCQIVI